MVLTVLSAMITTAIGLGDLGLTKQAVAWASVAQTGIAALLMILPRVQGDGKNRSTTDDV